MKKELQESLFKKYPKIFEQRHLPNTESAMCYGIQCPDEWYDLIDVLCACIQKHIAIKNTETNREIKKFKGSLYPRSFHRTVCQAIQVKIKFNMLRFYTTGGDDYISGLIAMAENMSTKIIKEK